MTQEVLIGQRISWRRKFLGLSMGELATKAGLSKALVSRIERGDRRDILVSRVRMLARALECKPDDLILGGRESDAAILMATKATGRKK